MVDYKLSNNDILIEASKTSSLSKDMLDSIFSCQNKKETEASRPEASFKQLMQWVNDNFNSNLKGSNMNNFIHNRICIDENFILFCEEKKIKIQSLYKDSIISWADDNKKERFLAQGVFKISKGNFEFLQSSLFHKGCNNEDEISFFITCSSDNYDKYIELRNEFEEWIRLRDRSNNEITVIGGDNIPYLREDTWEDLFLPEDLKKDIEETVNVFLTSQNWYIENKIPWKKGLFFYGVQGNGKTSIIKTIISQYNFKPVTICPGGNTEDVEEAFNYAEKQSPSLLYFEDLDTLLTKGQVDPSSFLNFMDGVKSKNGLFVIATANNPDVLPPNITDRPSRFDRKFEIPLPDKLLTKKYLKKWFGNKIDAKLLTKITSLCIKEEFTYAYLQELYIASMYNAISQNRKIPKEADINIALDRIIKERINLLYDNGVDINSYLNED